MFFRFHNEPDSVPLTIDGYGAIVSLSGFIHG